MCSGSEPEELLHVFEDLEQQAEGLHLAERDAEVADRGRAEYAAHVDLASRLHASTGQGVLLRVVGVGIVEGVLVSVGADWCVLRAEHGRQWLVRMAAVALASGLSERAISELARPVTARLSLGSALRRISEARTPAAVHFLDGAQSRGRLGRVGADFFELVPDQGAPDEGRSGRTALVSFGQVGALRRG